MAVQNAAAVALNRKQLDDANLQLNAAVGSVAKNQAIFANYQAANDFAISKQNATMSALKAQVAATQQQNISALALQSAYDKQSQILDQLVASNQNATMTQQNTQTTIFEQELQVMNDALLDYQNKSEALLVKNSETFSTFLANDALAAKNTIAAANLALAAHQKQVADAREQVKNTNDAETERRAQVLADALVKI